MVQFFDQMQISLEKHVLQQSQNLKFANYLVGLV